MISIIVPAFNYAHLLGETLENVSQQSFQDWECIIVDDGSTDHTREVANEWVKKDGRYQYVYQANGGLSAARNTGITHAQGEFIQLLDADDKLAVHKFSIQMKVFEENPHADIVFGSVRYFSTDNPDVLRKSMHGEDKDWMSGLDSRSESSFWEELIVRNVFVVNAPLIRSAVFKKIGLFNTALRSVEDWEYWCRCAFNGIQFHHHSSNDSHALVRTHAGSMSTHTPTMLNATYTARRNGIENALFKLPDRALKKKLLKQNSLFASSIAFELYTHYKKQSLKRKALHFLWYYAKMRGEYRFFIRELMK